MALIAAALVNGPSCYARSGHDHAQYGHDFPQRGPVDVIDTSFELVDEIANRRHIANGSSSGPSSERGYITAPRLSSRCHPAPHPASRVVHENRDVHDVVNIAKFVNMARFSATRTGANVLASLNFASRNQLDGWLRQMEALRTAA